MNISLKQIQKQLRDYLEQLDWEVNVEGDKSGTMYN